MTQARLEKLQEEMRGHWRRAEREIPDDPHAMQKDMNERANVMARVNHIIPEARRMLAEARADAIRDLILDGKIPKDILKSATLVKPLIEGKTLDYQKLVDDADRCSATLTHQCDVLRTDVSAEKQYLRTFGGDGRAAVDTKTGEIRARKITNP